jgi:uncharacterized linocin/CFP29 family protein
VIGGKIRWSPVVKGGILVSQRGGDYELTVGQDFAVGYEAQEKKTVELFIAESFTFQIFEPAAAVEFKMRG